MRRLHMHLEDDRLDDLISFLVVVGLRAHARFDPAVGQAETTYLYRRMRPRVIDWLRQELGDARPMGGGRAAFRRGLLTLDEMNLDEIPGHASPWQSDADAEAEWAEAIEQLSAGLSDEARETLELIGLRLVDGASHRAIADELGLSWPAVTSRLRRLREELEGGGGLQRAVRPGRFNERLNSA